MHEFQLCGIKLDGDTVHSDTAENSLDILPCQVRLI